MVLSIHQKLLDLYQLDILQHINPKDHPKLRAIFDSMPVQLNDKKRHFLVNSLHPITRLERYADSFNWLVDVGVALPRYAMFYAQATPPEGLIYQVDSSGLTNGSSRALAWNMCDGFIPWRGFSAF